MNDSPGSQPPTKYRIGGKSNYRRYWVFSNPNIRGFKYFLGDLLVLKVSYREIFRVFQFNFNPIKFSKPCPLNFSLGKEAIQFYLSK